MSSIQIQKVGILSANTEIIVNAANEQLREGGGVCGVIFKAAGAKKLQAACNQIGYCKTGSAVITPAFNLHAKYIVHAVGPIWKNGNHKEPQLLYNAYKTSLELAKKHQCKSIAFPLISSGIFRFPKDKAWRKALQACHDFIKNNPDDCIDIVFAIIDDLTLQVGLDTAKDLNIEVV